MKLIRENIINEKFREESDPIKDMGIGMKRIYYSFAPQETQYILLLRCEKMSEKLEDFFIRHSFFWYNKNNAWESSWAYPKDRCIREASKIFKQIEKLKTYKVVLDRDEEVFFTVPGYNVNEGVADKYTRQDPHLSRVPVEHEDFERGYEEKEAEGKQKEDRDKIVYKVSNHVYVMKNPTSLEKFSPDSRAIVNKNGDLYVTTYNVMTHDEMARRLEKLGELKYQDKWWQKSPTEFITIQRMYKENKFVLGESNEAIMYYVDASRRAIYNMPDTVESAKKAFIPFLEKAKKVNPQYQFIDKSLDDLLYYAPHPVKESLINEPKSITQAEKQLAKDREMPGLNKRILKTIKDRGGDIVKIYAVNADYVRDKKPGLNFDGFTDGGHHYVTSLPGYKKWIPENEIWIDDVFMMKPNDLRAILQHEFTERNLMKYKHWSYDKAHDYANKKESEYRERVKK